MYVFKASHVEPVQSAGVELVREVPLDPLAPLPLQPLAACALNTPPITMHRLLLRRFAVPVARPAIRLGNVRSYSHFGKSNHPIVTVISLVRHNFFHTFRMHCILACGRLLRDQASHCHTSFHHGFFHRRRVGGRSAMRGDSHDRAGLHVHGILGFIGQSGASVLQFSDFRFLIARAFPVFIGTLFLALAIHAEQRRRALSLDSFGFGKTLQVSHVAFARVAAHDRFHRRVGFQRSRIHADGLAFDEPGLRQLLQHPSENALMGFTVDQPSGTRDRDVIRRPLVQSDRQELPQRERIGETPRDAALAIESLEEPDHHDAEVLARRQGWTSESVVIETGAGSFAV